MPFRLLKESEAETIEALGETLVPGARAAGIAHFIDHQIAAPPEQALLQARIMNVRPPFANFYRAAIGAVDRRATRRTAASSRSCPRRASRVRQPDAAEQGGRLAGSAGAVHLCVLRSDAVDVVYSTMDGYEALGVPYMAHIVPERRW